MSAEPSRRRYFNSRPSARGDAYRYPPCPCAWHISIHAPPRGATFQVFCIPTEEIFQFTPLREGRRDADGKQESQATYFNSRPSARGDPTRSWCSGRVYAFQFTPLREGRRGLHGVLFMPMYFNSRPSARGDGKSMKHLQKTLISIHAPPRGATQETIAKIEAIIDISIHAPPRGATWSRRALRRTSHFNSRPSARGDIRKSTQKLKAIFQFTPLREGRPALRWLLDGRWDFNSRPSARGDLRLNAPRIIRELISIHAPPRGATLLARFRLFVPNDFNSRPSARGDAAGVASTASGGNFNSRPSARGDSKRYAISANLLFNPYKSAWLNNRATQFVEIILVIFHRIIA